MIAILDFKYDEQEERQKLHREISLKYQDGDEFYDKLKFIFFQMPLFTKTESELVTRQDKWLYFLKNLVSFDHIPAILHEPVFERAFETTELARLDSEEQFQYMQQQIVLWDNFAAMETAQMEGMAKGMEKGMAKGMEKGMAEGKAERNIEIALNMKNEGFDPATIAKMTGLSVEEIERLK